ncbi:nitrogen fixation protein NifQ [Roseiarcus fermentans]|uniref:Nitrogen fixation protein NifQ n=1 Tax=Roseiarcus fermentans TaxID=1473586 RepID=A0A366EM70_9HYPH|nr:nitrogen fixation protein NifQ [Roseiarcus fermentans]RBP03483.1 nitrogen fixation protein NifQ [Roseiarcus fermentans]
MFDERYAALRAAQTPKADDGAAFDDHVFACVLATGLTEEAAGIASLTDALGLTGAALARLIATRFPLGALPFPLWREGEPALEDEEVLLRALLADHRARDDEAASWLVAILSRRSMRDDHLWQDLGLFNRGELGRLLARHFPKLHDGNVQNMRWKKYFYRRICDLEGFSLCSAPHCSVCRDFSSCFGDEDGISRLAQTSRALTAA